MKSVLGSIAAVLGCRRTSYVQAEKRKGQEGGIPTPERIGTYSFGAGTAGCNRAMDKEEWRCYER